MNISGTINALRILYNPSLFLPSVTVSTFNDLPVPLPGGPAGSADEIKVVLLDKDNCFAAPHTNEVWPAYREQWARLRAQYPGDRLLIVSNTSGSSSDVKGVQATPAGQALADHARRVLQQMERMRREMAGSSTGLRSQFHIAKPPMPNRSQASRNTGNTSTSGLDRAT